MSVRVNGGIMMLTRVLQISFVSLIKWQYADIHICYYLMTGSKVIY